MGELRVISGQWGGRRIRIGSHLRPTADRVRTSLFDRLSPILPGARVLDLYAGTGALGIEALSRGAASALFVEKSPLAVKVLEANLSGLDAQSVSVRCDEAVRAVHSLFRLGRTFDLILADPPYAAGQAPRIVALLDQERLLESGGTLVVEHDRREALLPTGGNLSHADDRRYGDTMLTFYRGS